MNYGQKSLLFCLRQSLFSIILDLFLSDYRFLIIYLIISMFLLIFLSLLKLFEESGLLFELLLTLFLFLSLQTFLQCQFLCSFNLLGSSVQKFFSYFFFTLSLLSFELKVTLFVSLSSISIISKSSSGHRGGNIFYLFDSYGGDCVMSKLHTLQGCQALIYQIDYYIQLMEATEKREPVVLYQVPQLSELQVKSLIINSFPKLNLTLQHIQLRKKEGKYQAFLMVPSTQVQNFCGQKELKVGKEKVYVKKWNTQAQVFIGRLPDSLAVEDIRTYLENQFGKIKEAIEGQPHSESKIKLRHCYIQFEKDQDAEKCIFSSKKITVKGYQLRPSRAYAWSESDQTDKKLWLKVVTQSEDLEQLQRVLNQEFRKEGKMREKIRIEGNKAIFQYTSSESADRALQTFKSGKVGKYEVVLRPHASKDSYTVFVGGLKSTVTAQQLQAAFKHYSPLVSCSIISSNNLNSKNGTITFGSQQTFKRIFVEYKEDPLIRSVFNNIPYLTVHMSSKDRSDYMNFKRGKGQTQNKKTNIPAPIGFYPMYNQMPMQAMQSMQPMQPMGMYPPPLPYGRQMSGFGAYPPQSTLQ